MTDTVRNVTCLGCGCACDDLTIGLAGGRITSVEPPCPLAVAWFGDGTVPDRALVDARPAAVDLAIEAAADLLSGARGRLLAYIGTDLSTQAHRMAIAIADLLGATVDGPTSETAALGLLAAQRRGRASSTLGEVRNRADVVLCWAVDPATRYPRYFERYAPPAQGRDLLAVHVGEDRAPSGADATVSLSPEQEIPALSVLRATVAGNPLGELPPPLRPVADLAARLTRARYAAIVHDAEPGRESRRDPHRTEGLIALAQALNGPARATLSSLRGGGNRSGVESALTWQTGYPMAVEFTGAGPRYGPAGRGIDRLAGKAFDAVLIVGGAEELIARPPEVPTIAVGPRASERWSGARVALDTGVAGIHEAGTAYRMDEVPLPLTPPLSGARSARETLERLLVRLREKGGARS